MAQSLNVELDNHAEYQQLHHTVWDSAPPDAFHWERLPNNKCIWHCSSNGRSFDKKAPDFETERSSLWRDAEKQKEADKMKASINAELSKRNIVLV